MKGAYMFFVVMFLVNVLMPFHIYYRWISVAFNVGTNALAIKLFLLLLTAGPMSYFYTAHNDIATGWVKLTSFLFAVLALLFFSSLFYEILKHIIGLIPFKFHRSVNVGYLILVIIYVFSAITLAFRDPKINEVEISLKGYEGTPYKVAVLTDMHVGPILREEFTSRVVELVNQQNPEIVLIVGDLSDKRAQESRDTLAPLKNLKAKDGVYFSLGNHEYYRGDIPMFVDLLKDLNVRTLINESIYIGDEQRGFNLSGMTDLTGFDFKYMEPDYKKIKESLKKERPTILMAHRPKSFKHTDGAMDLQLSGHTHGGQVFPFHLFTYFANSLYLYGLHHIDSERQMFISRGTGFWGPPLRLFAPSEISILNIKKM